MPATINCEPDALMQAATCYRSCVSQGMTQEIIIYLLNVISGLDLTPQELMDRAKCYRCIPKGMQKEVQLDLLCEIASGATPTGFFVTTTPSGLEPKLGIAIYRDIPTLTKIVITSTSLVSGYDIERTTALTEIDLPDLISIDPAGTGGGTFTIQNNAALVTINAPNLTVIGPGTGIWVLVNNNASLTTVNLNSYVPNDGINIEFSNCALTASSVELILRRCVLAGVTTCSINLGGGTNAGLASLSAQGQLDAAALGAQLIINP